MKKSKPGAAPEKAEKPFEMVKAPAPAAAKDGGYPLRHVSTDTPGVKPRYDDFEPPLPKRGPHSGAEAATDAGFVALHMTAEEAARWRKEIEARLARNPSSWIFMRCDLPRCGAVIKTRPDHKAGEPCVYCNWQRRTDLGHVRKMTDAEVNTYLYEKAQRDKDRDERARRAAFTAENESRAKAGLPPFSYDEFKAKRKAEYQKMLKDSRELGAMSVRSREEVLG